VASPPTLWRSLDEVTPAALKRVEKFRAKVRRRVWSLLPTVPASKVAGTELGEVIVPDADATLVTAHSEKEGAAPNFKHGFGFHPIGVWSDNTGELLAITLRPGNAGSNHAGDHIDALARAIAQIPVEHRGRLLIRTDGAGATHGLLDWLTGQGRGRGCRVEYRDHRGSCCLGLALDGDLAKAEPKLLRFRLLHVPARLTPAAGDAACVCRPAGPGRIRSWKPSG
jgi:hypothetical protein